MRVDGHQDWCLTLKPIHEDGPCNCKDLVYCEPHDEIIDACPTCLREALEREKEKHALTQKDLVARLDDVHKQIREENASLRITLRDRDLNARAYLKDQEKRLEDTFEKMQKDGEGLTLNQKIALKKGVL